MLYSFAAEVTQRTPMVCDNYAFALHTQISYNTGMHSVLSRVAVFLGTVGGALLGTVGVVKSDRGVVCQRPCAPEKQLCRGIELL
jgi:hypothetical protein